MKKKNLITLVVISSLLLFVSCRKSFEDKAEHIVDYIDCKLELTDAQLESLNKIKDKAIAIKKGYRGDKEKMFARAKELMLKDSVKESEILAMVKTRRAHMDKITPEILPDILAFHANLTKEQKEKAVELMEKFKKKYRRWH